MWLCCVCVVVVDDTLCVDVTVTGSEGAEVHIKCSYSQGFEECGKYFYKGVYKERVLILSSGEKTVNDRFSMWDDKKIRTFTVTIRNLIMSDSGSYGCKAWCWFSRDYKQVLLKVNKGAWWSLLHNNVVSSCVSLCSFSHLCPLCLSAPVTSKPAHRFISTSKKQPPSPPSSIDTITDYTSTDYTNTGTSTHHFYMIMSSYCVVHREIS